MPPIVWHKIRSVVLNMAMKTISVAIDKIDSNDLPNIFSYMGYTFCGVTCLFGPWISFKDYISVRYLNNKVYKSFLIKNHFFCKYIELNNLY